MSVLLKTVAAQSLRIFNAVNVFSSMCGAVVAVGPCSLSQGIENGGRIWYFILLYGVTMSVCHGDPALPSNFPHGLKCNSKNFGDEIAVHLLYSYEFVSIV